MQKSVLIIRIDFLGDMLCTTPLIAYLKRESPDTRIYVLGTRYNKVVLDNNPHVEKVFTYVFSKQTERNEKPGSWNALISRVKLIRELRRLALDLILIPNGGMNKNSINFARQLGAKCLLFRDATNEFNDKNPEHCTTRALEHEAYSGFRLLNIDIHSDTLLKPELYLHPNGEKSSPKTRHRQSVGLFVSSRDPERVWSTRNWIKTAQMIHELGLTAHILWAPGSAFQNENDALIEQLQNELRGQHGIVFVPTPSTKDMFNETEKLDYAIATDGAPVHVCSALNIPMVALFENRAEKYKRWYPLGIEYELVIAEKGLTVGDIKPEQVAQSFKKLYARISVQNTQQEA